MNIFQVVDFLSVWNSIKIARKVNAYKSYKEHKFIGWLGLFIIFFSIFSIIVFQFLGWESNDNNES